MNEPLTQETENANLRNLMTLREKNKRLAESERLLSGLAWKTAQRYGLEFNEVLSEAHWSFMKACDQFEPKRGTKFTTFLTMRTSWDLTRWITNRAKIPVSVQINEEIVEFAPEVYSESLEASDLLSPNAKRLVHLILNPPKAVALRAPTAKQLLRAAKEELIKEGLTPRQAMEAHLEAREFFRSMWK